jgi:cell division septation protein DedD
MSEEDQFKVNFDGHDDDPKSSLDGQDEVQKSDLSTDSFPETNQDDQDESQELDLSHIVTFPEYLLGDQYELEDFGLSEDDSSLATDLNAASSEGEHAAEEPMHDEPEQMINRAGDSIKRMLLIVILLVVVGGAGVYYFLNQDVTAPTEPATAQTNTVPAALPPVPAAEPVAQSASARESAVAVNQPAIPAAKSVENVTAETPQEQTVTQPVAQVAGAVSEPQDKATKPASEAAPAQQKAADSVLPVPPPVEPAESAVPPVLVRGGAFTLDAGSYLMESNRDSLVAKIKKLGYEPLVTPINATLDMTRLSLGVYGKDEVQRALDFARSIEPGSYSAPVGDRYVVYAGTFQKLSNVEKLSQRFFDEGVKAYTEPVKVTRTLSRIRFGRFATKEDATSAAQKAAEVGLSAAVVKYK